MSIHSGWMNDPDEVAEMRTYQEYARRLEKIEMDKGRKQPNARAEIARKSGLAAGSIENLRRGRLKALTSFLKNRLRAALIRELEQEAARLAHQLSILRSTGVDPREDVVASAEAHLVAARAALNSAVR